MFLPDAPGPFVRPFFTSGCGLQRRLVAVSGDHLGYLGCLLVGCWGRLFWVSIVDSLQCIGVLRFVFRMGSEVSPGMALVVGVAQPFMQPQVNTLQSFCFVCASSEVVQVNGQAAR